MADHLHNRRLQGFRKRGRAVVTDHVDSEIELGDRRVGLVMFAMTVTQPEPGQLANQTMTPRSASPALTEDASPVLQKHVTKCQAKCRGIRRT